MKKTDDKAKGRLKGLSLFANAYHGTDRLDFTRFDIAQSGICNIGLHFGTKASALSRIEHLRENGRGTHPACPQFRVLTCERTLNNPFHIDDVFGHSYGFLLDALGSELGRARAQPSAVSLRSVVREPHIPHLAALQRKFDRLSARWMSADDNPRFAKDPSLYAALNENLNVAGEEMVKCKSRSRCAA